MSFAFRWPRPLWSRWRTPYDNLPGGLLLNRRAGQPGRKAPGRHMKTRLQPLFPCRQGVGSLRKEPAGRVEKPGAGLQLLTALTAAALARRNRIRLVPRRQQFRPQAFGAFGDQGGHRRPLPLPIQSSQRPRAHGAQPAVQRGKVWSVLAQPRHRLPQRDRGAAQGRVRGAGRLDDGPGVALAWSDLDGQDPHSPLADRAAAFRHRRRAMDDAARRRPLRPAHHPPTGINQRANGATKRADNPRADRFVFDGRGLQGIIRDGDRSRDSTLPGSPRGTGVCAPVPHFFQKAETLSPQRLPRKQVVHNRALMSMSFSVFSSEHPEPVRRVLPVNLRCH